MSDLRRGNGSGSGDGYGFGDIDGSGNGYGYGYGDGFGMAANVLGPLWDPRKDLATRFQSRQEATSVGVGVVFKLSPSKAVAKIRRHPRTGELLLWHRSGRVRTFLGDYQEWLLRAESEMVKVAK